MVNKVNINVGLGCVQIFSIMLALHYYSLENRPSVSLLVF